MLPKYEMIKNDLIAAIDSGKFQPGEKIFSEGELKKIYQVSSTTVVRALQDLVLSGYLIRKQGEGTFVRKNYRHKKVYFDEGGPLVSKKKQEDSFSNVVEKTTTTVNTNIRNKRIEQYLNGSGKGLTQVVQLATIDSFVWKIQIRYVLSDLLSDEAVDKLKNGGSLSKELKLEYNLTTLPMKADIKFKLLAQTAEVIQMIDREIQEVNWPINLPVVTIDRVSFDDNGKPIEFSNTIIHHNYYSIEIESEGM
ncbi:GntR family transcriptional regulator [Enterococcus massiliensis]|uniref:GntR family transcriptional regulator n=1 Tax=Enterococcus massiliensis TaxID=1640685 RepID=UPI00065E36D6|nr:GntR family transcriptional regulator [Enterococcus massiliensis]